MKKIMLVCAAGMSTSLLVTKMEKAAAAMGDEVEIFALPISEGEKRVGDFEVFFRRISIGFVHQIDGVDSVTVASREVRGKSGDVLRFCRIMEPSLKFFFYEDSGIAPRLGIVGKELRKNPHVMFFDCIDE